MQPFTHKRTATLAALALLTACAAPPPVPTAEPEPWYTAAGARFNVDAMEAAIASEVNRVRLANGLQRLEVDTLLVRAARIHAANMARTGKLAHTIPEVPEATLMARITLVQYPWQALAENLIQGYARADAAVAGWMASPGHRRNILNPVYHATGVGVAVSASGEVYACQVFAQSVFGRTASQNDE